MDGYPDTDEEYELMYADELELLREQTEANLANTSVLNEKTNGNPSKVNILENIVVTKPIEALNQVDVRKRNENHENFAVDLDDFGEDFDGIAAAASQSGGGSNNVGIKRTINDLFGNIDDLDDGMCLPKPKKLKSEVKDTHDEMALIEHILHLRKMYKERNNVLDAFNTRTAFAAPIVERFKDNISYRVPKYPFIGVTRCDGERLYIRFHSEEYEREERQRIIAKMSFEGVLGDRFRDVWNEAETLSEKLSSQAADDAEASYENSNQDALWVDFYKPHQYIELLSDESTNRVMLNWLKQWDKYVFNRRPKNAARCADLEADGRPKYKVALLCGPPGLGKTTLAHIIARHVGYNVIEMNASDDRNVDAFKTAVENATSMTSVLDREKRPNCLVFDEIDGAPSASIEFLIKYVSGQRVSNKKGKQQQQTTILKRPIICICNDMYVPALRNLRQIAFVCHFPPTNNLRLTERLKEIAANERMQIGQNVLRALGEKSHNDIRSCLGLLHFFKAQNKRITLADVMKRDFGVKDMQKGLFSVWQEIFQIPKAKTKDEIVTLATRWQLIQQTVQSFGDYERLAQGVFENYTAMPIRDSTMAGTCYALDWFCQFDLIQRQINQLQNYTLAAYLPFAFIVWHYMFAGNQWQKINYPTKRAEMRTNQRKCKALLGDVMKGMKATVRCYVNEQAVKLDILPLLAAIITPQLRPVNLHLYTKEERAELQRIVYAMIDYNLTFRQERMQEGGYDFNIEPNIDEIVKFSPPQSSTATTMRPTSNGNKSKRQLSYSHRQLIAREIEVERMRRLEVGMRGLNNPSKSQPTNTNPTKTNNESQNAIQSSRSSSSSSSREKEKQLPNHLQKLQAKNDIVERSKRKRMVTRDFFHVIKPATKTMMQSRDNDVDDDGNNQIDNNEAALLNEKTKEKLWYEYKEGYTNAVKRPVKNSFWF